MPKIDHGAVKHLPVPVPPPSEQEEIAHILTSVDRKLAADEQRRQALDALFKSLLDQLMTGAVRLKLELVADPAATYTEARATGDGEV